jgi:hypothetical protein
MRDVLIQVRSVLNNRPVLSIPPDITVLAGEAIEFSITVSDPDSDPVVIETVGIPYEKPEMPATYEIDGNTLSFFWQTNENHIQEQPYEIVFRARDFPSSGQFLYDYKAWKITVTTLTSDALDIADAKLKIFPNPTTGFITIENLKNLKPFQIIITDQLGKMIFMHNSNVANNEDLSVDLSDKPGGIYFIRYNSRELTLTKKILLLN